LHRDKKTGNHDAKNTSSDEYDATQNFLKKYHHHEYQPLVSKSAYIAKVQLPHHPICMIRLLPDKELTGSVARSRTRQKRRRLYGFYLTFPYLVSYTADGATTYCVAPENRPAARKDPLLS